MYAVSQNCVDPDQTALCFHNIFHVSHSASIFKVFQCCVSKFMKMSECRTDWIWVATARLLGVSSGSKLFAYGTIVVSGGLIHHVRNVGYSHKSIVQTLYILP